MSAKIVLIASGSSRAIESGKGSSELSVMLNHMFTAYESLNRPGNDADLQRSHGTASSVSPGLAHNANPAPVSHLTVREREVVSLLANGLRVSRIAAHLRISEGTVELHLRNARCKLRSATNPQAVARALLLGEILI